jgi:ABC-2 type transport system ATP-binding protein
LRSLEEKGVTIFINSHLLAEVELFCEEVAILRRGEMVLSGKVRDLVAGRGYRLSVADVPARLQAELAAHAASVSGNNGVVHFQFSTREQVNEAIDSLRAEKCEIEAVVPTTSTLEDVFVKAVEQ